MTAQRCDTTDLLVDQCAHCQGHRSVNEQVAAEKAEHAGQPGWIEAQYSGACYRCGEPISIGDLIRLSDPHRSAGWIGTCCAPEPEVSL